MHSLTNNDKILFGLVDLKSRTPQDAMRNNKFWQGTFSINKYGEQSTPYTLPVLLNMFFQHEIVTPTPQKKYQNKWFAIR